MDVFEAIEARRSIRAYRSDPVPNEKIRKVLEAGRQAPSAVNRQPWHFIVVQDRGNLEKLSHGRFAGFLREAPLVIVGCGDRKASERWYLIDVSIAMQQMVLAATAEGLGTCWVGSFDERKVMELLDIPERFTVVAMIAMGYPRNGIDLVSKLARSRRRKALEEITSSERFGTPLDL